MLDQPIIPPDLDDLLVELKSEIFANLNCIQIGKIEKVNDNQTVEIQIQFKRRVSGNKTVNYPLLVDCPYIVMQGGKTRIGLPVSAGDYCLILFNDRNIDEWWSTENVKEPQDTRKHNLSDGFALVGINSSANSIQLSDDLEIIAADKKVRIKNDAETMKTLMDDLIDAVNAIVTTNGGTVNPASQAVLNSVKLRMGDLYII